MATPAVSVISDEAPEDHAVQRHCRLVRTMLLGSARRYGDSPDARSRALGEVVGLVPEAIACGLSVAEIAEVVGVTEATLEAAVRRHEAATASPQRFVR